MLSTFTLLIQPISRTLFTLQSWNSKPIKQQLPIPPPLGPWQSPLYFLSLNLIILGTSYKWNHTYFCLFVSGLLHLTSCPHNVVVCVRISFLRLNDTLSYVCTTCISMDILCVYTTLCLSMDTWVASTFWLLWIMLLWAWVYKYLFDDPAFNSLGYTPWNGIAGLCSTYIFNFLKNCHMVFHRGCTI